MNVEKTDIKDRAHEVLFQFSLNENNAYHYMTMSDFTDFDKYSSRILIYIMQRRLDSMNRYFGSNEPLVMMAHDLYYIIDIMANGPTCALLMFYHLIETIVRHSGHKIHPGYIITSKDFLSAFPKYWDTNKTISDRLYWENIWIEQKDENGNNKIDSFDYWKDLFEC